MRQTGFSYVFWLLILTSTATFGGVTNEADLKYKPIGSQDIWLADNGVTTVTYIGPVGDFYGFRLLRDASMNDPIEVIFFTNRQGESTISWVNGLVTTFSPSDCSLTIGRCSYVERRSDGFSRFVILNQRKQGNKLLYSRHQSDETAGNLSEIGVLFLDQLGKRSGRNAVRYHAGKAVPKWSRLGYLSSFNGFVKTPGLKDPGFTGITGFTGRSLGDPRPRPQSLPQQIYPEPRHGLVLPRD